MRYFKTVTGGYIDSISTGCGGEEITEDEYNAIKTTMLLSPKATDGYDYRLKSDLTWELYELPVAEEDLTAEEALEIILGGEV